MSHSDFSELSLAFLGSEYLSSTYCICELHFHNMPSPHIKVDLGPFHNQAQGFFHNTSANYVVSKIYPWQISHRYLHLKLNLKYNAYMVNEDIIPHFLILF